MTTEKEKQERRKILRELRETETKKKKEHKESLETRYNIVGHPKADKLYKLAWEYGHSSGYSEVEYYYDDLVELVK